MLCCFTRRLWLDTRPRCSPSASLTSCQWILSHVAPTCFSCGRCDIWIGCKEKTSWNRSGGTDVCTLLAGREHECVASKFWRHMFLRVRRWSLHIYIYICSFGKGNVLVRFREALWWSERWRKYRHTWAGWLCSKRLAISRAPFFEYYDRSDSVCMRAAWRSWQISGWGTPAQGRAEQRLNSAQSQYVDVYNKRL